MTAFRARQQASKGRIDLLPPEPQAATRQATVRRQRLEVVEADFVVIGKGTAQRTHNDNRRPVESGERRSAALSLSLRAGAALARVAEHLLQRLPGHTFAGVVAFVFLSVFALAGGFSALQAALPTPVPAEPLRIADVRTTIDDRNGMKVLAIYGRIDNTSPVKQAVPMITVEILGSGTLLRRQVETSVDTLPAGRTGHFSLHIPHSGGKLPKVSVSFAPAGAPTD
jgi:hypothetical protein